MATIVTTDNLTICLASIADRLAAPSRAKIRSMSPEELRFRLERAGLTPYRLSFLLGVEPNEGSKWMPFRTSAGNGTAAAPCSATKSVSSIICAARSFGTGRSPRVEGRPSLDGLCGETTGSGRVTAGRTRRGRALRPVRNCDRRLGRASARFTPTSFAPIISPASAALRDKARDPFSGSPSSQHEAGDAAGEIEALEQDDFRSNHPSRFVARGLRWRQ
jgi:hypothetical protein